MRSRRSHSVALWAFPVLFGSEALCRFVGRGSEADWRPKQSLNPISQVTPLQAVFKLSPDPNQQSSLVFQGREQDSSMAASSRKPRATRLKMQSSSRAAPSPHLSPYSACPMLHNNLEALALAVMALMHVLSRVAVRHSVSSCHRIERETAYN